MLPQEMEPPSGSAPASDPEELVRELEDALPDPARAEEVLLDVPQSFGNNAHVRVGIRKVRCFVDRLGAVYLKCAQDELVHHGVILEDKVHLRAVEISPIRLLGEPWLRVRLEVT